MPNSTPRADAPFGPPVGRPIGPATEPLVVFVARGAPTPRALELGQLKHYLRPALGELQELFENKYGNLEGRSYWYCPLIHKSVPPLEPGCDSFRSLTDFLTYARTYGRVSAHYQGLIRLEDEYIIDDALRYVVRVEEVRGVRIGVEESVSLMVELTGAPETELLERVLWML